MVESSDKCGPLEKRMGNHFSILALRTPRMASDPITSGQIDGETMETVTDFLFLGSKITAGGDCSHEIKRCLLLGGKPMLKVDTKLKSRDLFANKGLYHQSYDFSSSRAWTIKKAEH